MAYRYTPQYRPPEFYLPEGWRVVEQGRYFELPLRRDVPMGRHPFGVIEYDRPLTDREKSDFQLEPV